MNNADILNIEQNTFNDVQWKTVKLGDLIIDSYAGGTPNRAREDYFGGNIPWVSSGEVNNPIIDSTIENITQAGLNNSSAKWIPENSILLALYGATAGQVSILRIKATANQAVLAIIPNEKEVNTQFLYYQLIHNKHILLYMAQGSGQPNLSKTIADKLPIAVPSLPLQRRIADILSSADKVIASTESLIEKYKAIKQGLLNDLLKPKEGWKMVRLGDVVIDSFAGGTPNRSREDYFGGDIPWVTSGEVNNPIINHTLENITLLGLTNSSAKWIPKNSILVALYGATAGQVSMLKINATSNQAVLAIIPNDKIIDTDFLYYQIIHNKLSLLFLAQGSGQPNLSKNIVDYMCVNLPSSLIEQRRISAILQSADAKIAAEQKVLEKYKGIKKGLMEALLKRGNSD